MRLSAAFGYDELRSRLMLLAAWTQAQTVEGGHKPSIPEYTSWKRRPESWCHPAVMQRVSR
jgi:hypothetical protein